jgi:PD-(D/E)XK nuclease superfamily
MSSSGPRQNLGRQVSIKSFIEWVSVSAREPVFSAALAWVLSDDSPLPLDQRLSVVGSICGGRPMEGGAITCTTEYERIDVLVTVERPGQHLYIGIENKIKAAESKDQLAIYDRHLDALPGSVERIFLTLTGERPVSGRDWKAVSYLTFADISALFPSGKAPGGMRLRASCEYLTT